MTLKNAPTFKNYLYQVNSQDQKTNDMENHVTISRW
jgi:hypothetical protein